MKCPECNANFSELRDVCPGCTIDLRSYKEKFKLPISFPDLPYEELLTKFPKTRNLSKFLKVPSPAVAPAEVLPSPGAASLPATSVPKTPHEELLDEFQRAYEELLLNEGREFSLGTIDVGLRVPPNEIRLLFEVIDDELAETAKYVDEVQLSVTKTVEAVSLQRQLSKLEKMVEAPLFSLKGTQGGVTDAVQQDEDKIEVHARVAPKFLGGIARTVAFLIDAAVIIIVSIMLALFLLHAADRETYFETLYDLLLAFGDVVTVAMGMVIPLATLYLLVSSLLFERTFGLYLVGGKYSLANGHPISASLLVIRSLLAAPSMIFMGFIPLLMGKKSWHDRAVKSNILALGSS